MTLIVMLRMYKCNKNIVYFKGNYIMNIEVYDTLEFLFVLVKRLVILLSLSLIRLRLLQKEFQLLSQDYSLL